MKVASANDRSWPEAAIAGLSKTVIYPPPARSAAPAPRACRLAWWRCPHAPAGRESPRAGRCSQGREPNARQDVPELVLWLPAKGREVELEESLIGHDRYTQRLIILPPRLYPPQEVVHNEPGHPLDTRSKEVSHGEPARQRR